MRFRPLLSLCLFPKWSISLCLVLLTVVLAGRMNAQWTEINANIPGNLYAVAIRSTNVDFYMVGGESGIWQTTNAGSTWTKVVMNSADSVIFNRTTFRDLRQDGNNWIAGGDDRLNGNGNFFYTLSNGNVWYYAGSTPHGINAVSGGSNGFTAYCDDGYRCTAPYQGPNWTCNYSGYPADIHGFSTTGSRMVSDSAIFINQAQMGVDATPGGKGIEIINSIGVVVDSERVRVRPSITWFDTPYFDGPLVGRCVHKLGTNRALIGCKSGVFRGGSPGMQIWEFQPSSSGYAVNDIASISFLVVAVCDSGHIIRNYSAETEGVPYLVASIPMGACVGIPASFTNSSWSVHSFQWRVNGSLVSSSYNYTHTFASPGTYTVSLIATNGPWTDTLTTSVTVVPAPITNFPFTVDDTLHCKAGTSTITIPNSSPQFQYQLLQLPSNQPVASALGNGGSIQLSTGLVTDTTHYRIRMSSTVTSCSDLHVDTVHIYVENTHARYVSGLYNASIGEQFKYYNHSSSAATYEWNFGSGSSPATATTALAPPVSYATTGDPIVRLVAISAMGCRDTLDSLPVTVYDPGHLHERMWALDVDGDHPIFELEGRLATDTSSGAVYLYVNYDVDSMRLSSNYGRYVELKPPYDQSESVLAKYDSAGVLKWAIKLAGSHYVQTRHRQMTVDGQGNLVFVTYHSGSGSIIHFPNGSRDTTLSATMGGLTGGIYKVSPAGELIWEIDYGNAAFMGVQADERGHVYTFGSNTSFFRPNGTRIRGPVFSNPSDFLITKFSPTGQYIRRAAVNSILTPSMEMDDAGGVWLSSAHIGLVRDADSVQILLPRNLTLVDLSTTRSGSIMRMDSTLHFDWTKGYAYPYCSGCFNGYTDHFRSMAMDKHGGMYFEGVSRINPFASQYREWRIENMTGSYDTLQHPKHFFGLIDSTGTLSWIQKEPGYNVATCEGSADLESDRIGNLIIGHQGYDTLYLMSQGVVVDTIMGERQFVFTRYSPDGTLLAQSTEPLLDPSHVLANQGMGYFYAHIDDFEVAHNGDIVNFSLRPNNDSTMLVYAGAGETHHTVDEGAGMLTRLDWTNNNNPEIRVSVTPCALDSVTLDFTVDPSLPIYPGNQYRINGMMLGGYFNAGLPMLTFSSTQTSHSVRLAIPASVPSGAKVWFEVESTEPPLQGVSNRLVRQLMIAPVDTSLVYCAGSSIYLLPTAGTSHLWSPASWVNSPTGSIGNVIAGGTGLLTCAVQSTCGAIQDSFHLQYMVPPSVVASANDTICFGDSIQISATSVGNITWTPNLNISNPTVAAPIVYPSFATNYIATATVPGNSCPGDDTVRIDVINLPDQIFQNGNTLSTNPGYTYQWLMNGQPIPGATQVSYVATVSGSYSVILFGNGCSEESPAIQVTVVEVLASQLAPNLEVYPNPTSGDFRITLRLPSDAVVSLRLWDPTGKEVACLLENALLSPATHHFQFSDSLRPISRGIYFLEVTVDSVPLHRVIVVE